MPKPVSLIPEEHLAAVGLLTTWWARLEFEVDRTTWRIASIGQTVGACLTAQMPSIHGKMKALIAVAEQIGLDEGLRDRLNKFQASVGGLGEARNRAVHDTRMLNGEGAVHRLQITAPKKLVFEMKPEPIEELWDAATKVQERIDEFMKLQEEIFEAYDAMPKMHADLIHTTPPEAAPASPPENPS